MVAETFYDAIKNVEKALIIDGYPSVTVVKMNVSGNYVVVSSDSSELGLMLNEKHNAEMVMKVEKYEWLAIKEIAAGNAKEVNANGDNKKDNRSGQQSGDNNSGIDSGESPTGAGGQNRDGELSGANDNDSEINPRDGSGDHTETQ